MAARRYTDQQFRDAVADPEVRTIADLCRRLGLVPRGGNYESVRERAVALNVDLAAALRPRRPKVADAPGRRRRTWTDTELLEALTDPRIAGYRELCDRLGLGRFHENYRTIRERAAELGVPLPAEWSIAGPRPGGPGRGRRHDIDHEELAVALVGARTRRQVLERLGLEVSSSTYAALQRALVDSGLSSDHLIASKSRARPLELYLVAGRPPLTGLGRRLIDEARKPHRCERCGRETWEEGPIPLELDHIDGDRWNNRIENLRLLCPNCHALTPTYRGRNIGRRSPVERRRA